MEPTNNVSERILRPSVIFRKVTNCFRSDWGAKIYADLCSIVGTGRLSEPLAAIRAALTMRSKLRHPLIIGWRKGVSNYKNIHYRELNPKGHNGRVRACGPIR
jgi:hypothetical protein